MTRLISYSVAGRHSVGALSHDGAGVVSLPERLEVVRDLDDIIAGGLIAEALAVAQGEPADHALDEIRFERLIRRPSKIFCIGVNYGGRAGEYSDRSDASYPSVFPRWADSLTGHDRDLIRPPESPQLDYEGEIVAVIGTGGRRIPVADARSHIAGLSLGNEGTVRDWVRHAKFNVTQGKNWACSGSIGPWLTPLAEIGGFESLRLRTRVNGELRQDDTPASMKYPIEYQIHYLSTFTELSAGDVIFTGTPTGAGARLDPPVWLAPGDVVEVSVPELGTLRNTIRDEFDDGRTIDPPAPR